MALTSEEKQFDNKIKESSLHVKFDKQLTAMRVSHENKLLQPIEDLDKITRYPDAIRYELDQQLKEKFNGQALIDIVEEELINQRDYYLWKTAKLNEVVELIDKEIEFRQVGKVTRNPIGTTFYIDSDNGNDGNNGTATGTAWATLHKFTENPRNAGDIAIVRMGRTARYDDGGNLDFTSDGIIENPIIIEADYGNAFSDDVDLSVTATATLVFGSKTITFSADISSVLAAGDFIYVAGDDAKEFAYEVDSVVTTTVTLFLPYKGDQAGSGKTMTNMQHPPIWGTAAGSFEWNFDNDHYWKVQGIHIRGNDPFGTVELDTCTGHAFYDVIIEGAGGSSSAIKSNDDATEALLVKVRLFDHFYGVESISTTSSGHWVIIDSLFDMNGVGSSKCIRAYAGTAIVIDSEFKGAGAGDIGFGNFGQYSSVIVRLRNTILASTTEFPFQSQSFFCAAMIEDYDGVLNNTRQFTSFATADGDTTIQSETTTVRSGGGTQSIKVLPSTRLSTIWKYSRILVFEYPIYAATGSKTYTVYFRPTATADWTADPTNTELWIELEAWGHASNNYRKITKSTGVIDMNGSTSWQTLTVTVNPAQTGVAYLRVYYAKTKESGKANTFFTDTKIDIA